jgi:hypothetical protein
MTAFLKMYVIASHNLPWLPNLEMSRKAGVLLGLEIAERTRNVESI